MSRSALVTSDTLVERACSPGRFGLGGLVSVGLLVGGCAEPSVLTAPMRQPRMTLADHERVPLPIAAVPTGGATFDRAANESSREGLSLLPAGRSDGP